MLGMQYIAIQVMVQHLETVMIFMFVIMQIHQIVAIKEQMDVINCLSIKLGIAY